MAVNHVYIDAMPLLCKNCIIRTTQREMEDLLAAFQALLAKSGRNYVLGLYSHIRTVALNTDDNAAFIDASMGNTTAWTNFCDDVAILHTLCTLFDA
ncbi:hypothetical protein WJX72_003493 [[Myrmecia] bisecta]|uniref:Uncharacterized protein n=1 Tax=[Myrmecia] bisecta TaxID=41462 RepID=A0AAW1P4L2_9CHLO